MKRIRLTLGMLLVAAVVGPVPGAAAQVPPEPSAPESVVQPPTEPDVPQAEADTPIARRSQTRQVVRIGQDYTLRPGDAVSEVVVIYGTATIEGHVDRDVVVVLGTARLSGTASLGGSLIVVGGSATAAPGASVRRDLIVIGGAFDAPAGFAPGGEHVVIGPAVLGGNLEAIVPWVTRGLLWGRPIVPDLPWVWGIVGIFFLVYLTLNLVFDRPVRACAGTLAQKPLTAFAVGLLVLLLTGPVSLLLMVSVIGIAVVPFVLCALFAAWIIGRVGVVRWIGMSAVPEDSPESRLQPVRSFLLGFAVICVAYMIPVLGFIVFAMVGVFGLGSAALAFIAAYRRENPAPGPASYHFELHPRPLSASAAAPPPVPYAPPMPDPPAASYQSASAAVDAPVIASGSPAPAAGAVATADLTSFPRAFFLDRLAAFVLDIILVLIGAQLLNVVGGESGVFLLLLAYHIGFWTWKGTTVGGIICQLRVVRVDGAPLRFVDALVRGLSSIFSLVVLGIDALWILKDAERQSWHDKIAGTYVVKVPRNWPL